MNQKNIVFVTRKAYFTAAHKLFNPNWSIQKNEEVFGKCANHNWHGHNFDLYVTIKGEPDSETGFVMDLKQLKKLIDLEIIQKFDHKNINTEVEMLKGKMASIENIIIAIWNTLSPLLPKEVLMHKLFLKETESNFCEYYGPEVS